MKCQHCAREVLLWQATCPHCKKQTKPNTFSTITETPESLEQRSRRKLLQQVLQFALVAVMCIGLASLVRFPPKASPLSPENSESASPAPSPVSEAPATASLPEEASPVEAPKPTRIAQQPEVELPPLSLLTPEDLGVINRAASAAKVATRGVPVATNKKPTTAKLSTDDVPSKKVTQTILPTSPTGITTSSAAPSSAQNEPEPKLEVEMAGVVLHPNTGLLTIKSYVPARVYIDGVYSGSTPRSVKLLAGEHTISLLADGYNEYSRKVKVSGQQQVGILASMSKK